MRKSVRTIAVFLGVLLILLFVVFVVGETAQVVELADRVSPQFGTLVFWVLIAAYLALILVPLVTFLRLPKALLPPPTTEGLEFEAFLANLRRRLAQNAHIQGSRVDTREDVERALAELNTHSDRITRDSAGVIFLSTAISQSGRLDAFVVLVELTRMIWRIAHLYYQRPTLRDLIRLYANVAGTAFVAGQLDDIDISEHLTPLLMTAGSGVSGAIPGLQVAATIIADSVMTGAANAFLTLRVGVITRRYCGCLSLPGKREIRRGASLEAAQLLGAVVAAGSSRISRSAFQVTKSKVGGAVTGAGSAVAEISRSLAEMMRFKKRPDGDPGEILPVEPEPENT